MFMVHLKGCFFPQMVSLLSESTKDSRICPIDNEMSCKLQFKGWVVLSGINWHHLERGSFMTNTGLARSLRHTLSWSFSAWICLLCRPVTWHLFPLQVGEPLRWFYSPAAIRGVEPMTHSYGSHFHSFYFYLSVQEALKSSKLLLDCSSKEDLKWKVGREGLGLSWLLHLRWCHP